MIITKDGITLGQVREVLAYIADSESHFLLELKPEGEIHPKVNKYHEVSVIRVLKLDDYVHVETGPYGHKELSRRYRIKLLVEDRYFEKNPENENYFESGKVPARIHTHISAILSRNV